MTALRPRAAAGVLALAIIILICGCTDDKSTVPSRDRTPPTVVASYPQDGAPGVTRSGPFWIAFSEPMDRSSVENAISVAPAFGLDMHFSADRDTVFITPRNLLAAGAGYTITAAASCADLAGNEMGIDHEIAFTTTAADDSEPPRVLSTTPADGAEGVNCGAPLRITFSEPVVYPGDWNTQTAVVIDPWPDTGFFERQGNDLVVWHTPFPMDSLIDVTLTTALTDLAGNPLAETFQFSFRTEFDDTPPYLASASPANGETGVSSNTQSITLRFSEPIFPDFDMPPQNVDARVISAATAQPEWNEDYTTITIPCANGLLPGCTYWLYLEDVTDMAGNAIDPNPTHYSFTTAGTRNYYPVVQGYEWYYLESGGPGAGRLGGMPASDYRAIENYNPSAGTFEEVWYEQEGGHWLIREKAFLCLSGNILQHLGRAEYRDGVLQAIMTWDEPISYLRLPPQNHPGTDWPLEATATVGPYRIELSGSIGIEALTENVLVEQIGGIFHNCIRWRIDVEMTRYDNGTAVENVIFRQIFFLAEGVGPVMVINEQTLPPSPPDTLTLIGWNFNP